MHFFSDSQRPALSFLRTQRRDAEVAAKDKENWQIEKYTNSAVKKSSWKKEEIKATSQTSG